MSSTGSATVKPAVICGNSAYGEGGAGCPPVSGKPELAVFNCRFDHSLKKEIPMDESNATYGWNPGMSMTLQDKLREDLKLALRSRNDVRKNAIRQIMSEFFKLTMPVVLEGGKKSTRPKKTEEITNDDIIGIIQGLIKSEHIVLEAKKETGSDYLQILEAYLPRQVSQEEIAAWIKSNIDFGQFKNKMQAMGAIMKHFGKTADGKLVNRILREWT
jgi:uncharacterized protein YqeY